ncbi:hypothetical protein TSACC_3637 [Terrimicrobium sacchariphilum]|uniref:Glycosyl-hydrolase family 116 catalytic region domain-containing protein n=2 Tax=Terrimicrobium sacchariphilum TaxID=690879 RepID=A0A146GGN5_TERSA|nr:hypothetical protein TSACC_3637 [Terrimicrobium sacchariphilum]
MPLGGIGAGCICFNGYGGLQDFSIRNRPSTTALPDENREDDAGFALLHIKGDKPVTRLVEGPFPPGKIYDQGLQGRGCRHGGYEGLPRFRQSRFESGYPFAQVTLSDRDMPVEVRVTGWSPFVPLDEIASSVPAAMIEYSIRNTSRKAVECEFSFHLAHPAVGASTKDEGTRCAVIPGKGVHFTNTEPSDSETFGEGSLTVIGPKPRIKATWIRGGFFDGVSALWREVETGKFQPNDGTEDAGRGGRNGGSVEVKVRLRPGEKAEIPVIITWYFPNSNLTFEQVGYPVGESPRWRTYYSSLWRDARDVVDYLHEHYEELRRRTVAFQNALLSSSLPPYVLDAVSANLAIIKSPTVLRQASGNLWAWEGSATMEGSCHGSCTHVWNYAQAFPHLFPAIERTLREQELERSIDERGHVNFRAALPDGPNPHTWYAAADGQLGGIMKLYRDWQISGDTAWLRRLYPLALRSIEYCINQWDPDRIGAVVEPHHNTYDIEFWGADGMCTTIYAGALSAMSEICAALGDSAGAEKYRDLASRSARYLKGKLFNGEYFEQKVQYRGLRDTSFLEKIAGRLKAEESDSKLRLMKKEGPLYQYGKGCLSDGVIGAWMAQIYGISTPLDDELVRKSLYSIHRYNFRKDLSDHANCQRPGYAIGSESGLLLCSWPRGGKPTLPFIYSDEVWTGIEYQVASHLIECGLVREGLQIVKAVRSRYDGAVRNPWNEYECGNYYARALASFALLGSLSGFRYSAVTKTLWFAPKISKQSFQTFFSTASGYGIISLDRGRLTVRLIEGTLSLRSLVLGDGNTISLEAEVAPGRPVTISLLKKNPKKP